MIEIQTQDFDAASLYEQLRSDCPNIGAIVSFTGLMRDFNEGDNVSAMTLEHYPGMTEKSLLSIAEQAKSRWPIHRIIIVHRVGKLLPSDQIVYVGVNSAHRKAAFNACEFIMDYLKTQAPFWKKESTAEGERWVDARQSDSLAAKQWQESD